MIKLILFEELVSLHGLSQSLPYQKTAGGFNAFDAPL